MKKNRKQKRTIFMSKRWKSHKMKSQRYWKYKKSKARLI